MSQKQKYSLGLKLKLLKAHLVEKQPVTEVCQPHGIKPSLFYKWQQDLFKENAGIFAEKNSNKTIARYQKIIKELEQVIAQKDTVLAELMQDYLHLKKGVGEKSSHVGYHHRNVMKW